MIRFKVQPDHGDSYIVEAGSRDVLLWERTTKGRTFSSLADSTAMTDMYRLCYLAAKRTSVFAGTEREFEDGHEIEIAPDNEAPDPTP